MARYAPALVTTLLMACSTGVLAASSTDLGVRGALVPSSCTPLLSDGGIVDHGKLSVRDLHPDEPTHLHTSSLQMEISCEAPTLFTLTTIDNRAGTSAIHPASHGLGMADEHQKLGSVAFRLYDVIADGQSVLVILSLDGGATWRLSPYLGHLGKTGFASPDNLAAPIAVRKLNARLSAFTTLVPGNDLSKVDDILIDGHATVQVTYL